MVHPSERISVNGVNIPANELERLLEKQESNGAATFFHAYTGAAFEWFLEKNVDFAVFETGLGGRLDPTNVIKANVGILTSIGIDHTNLLGSDIEKIACEKCGIIKPVMRMVTCAQRPQVMEIIRNTCMDKGCALQVVSPEDIRVSKRTLQGQQFDFDYDGKIYKDMQICMLGLHQPQNACLAAAACLFCGIEEEAVRIGLAQTQIISRFEYFRGMPPVILDGAHNVDSADELRDTLRAYFKDKEFVLLTAVMADKDIKGILETFASFAHAAVTVKADETRGEEADVLAHVLQDYGVPAESENGIEAAFIKAKNLAVQKDALLVVSGSFYLTGRVRQFCLEGQA